jgi:hypothetical protein
MLPLNTGSEKGQATDFCEHDNETLGAIKAGKSIGKLSDFQLLKDCAPWSWLNDRESST